MSDFVEYKPMDVEYNVKAAVENLRKAYQSNEPEKIAKAFTEARTIIVSAICTDKYTVCKTDDERPQGGLISREALKKEGENLVAGGAEGLKDYYENGSKSDENSWIGGVYDAWELINSAPTVELSPVINMKPLTAEEKQGLIDAFKKSRLEVVKLDDEGIQGEWARHDEWVNGEYVGGFYHVNCPVIEEGYALYSRWETRFCPNCGAPMLKGGDDA